MRKKVDDRIRNLVENGVNSKHRSMFVIIGDKSRDQIVNLYHMLTKSLIKSRPSVLWCYKESLELSSHKRKRAKQIKKLMLKGLIDPEKADPFSLFLESGVVSYCLYKDSERILGNTYGMCILQDFEALTPNILARTIETVEGGGLIILLLRTLSSLMSLCTMVMDVHERFRTESHSEIISRFNERFLLSLASCKACLVMDDELNILPISSHVKSISTPVLEISQSNAMIDREEELKNLKEQLHDVSPVGPLIEICTTLDQGKSVMTFLDVILDKNLKSTISLIASRGRGKSAALGLAIAGAIVAGYSRIFVTAPCPSNLKSLFEFACRGLRSLKYEEHLHYDLIRSSSLEFQKAITQINVYKDHKQIVQYIQPGDHAKLSHAELLIIDEAAAIPLPIVKALLGPYLVFISSTVNGYEGTGRSLSLKLLNYLEKDSQNFFSNNTSNSSGRLFQRIELNEPVRYSIGDPIEAWLNGLLCLNATNSPPPVGRLPHPTECNLYYVNRDTLFSFHKESETFLQRMVALFVSSHYKNSPNDLQLMADAPAHHLFVLLGPVDETSNVLPDIFCVIQACLEGQISSKSVLQNLEMGRLPSGDLLPWKFAEEFENAEFPTLSGVRIVRIAAHPSVLGHGYGSAALELLTRYYEGKLISIDEMEEETSCNKFGSTVMEAAKKVSLLEEAITPRENLPPLLLHPRERTPERVDYLGASFGLNRDLFRFWRRHSFSPFYVCDNPNDTTGEHSCMVLKLLVADEIEHGGSSSFGLAPFFKCFKRKFVKSLPLSFQQLDYKVAMSVLDPKIDFPENEASSLSCSENENSSLLRSICSLHELKLLDAYSESRKDHWKVRHLVPLLAHFYFEEMVPVTLTHLQASILLCMGLQLHDVAYIEVQMKIERQQVLHLFRKIMLKFYKYVYRLRSKELDASFPQNWNVEPEPHAVSLEEDLNDGARKVMEKEMVVVEDDGDGKLDPVMLQQYSNNGTNGIVELEQTLQRCSRVPTHGGIISVKSNEPTHVKRKAKDSTHKSQVKKNHKNKFRSV